MTSATPFNEMSEFEQSAIKLWYNNIECFISPKLKQILTKIKASRARSSKFTITEIENIIKTYVVKHKYVYNKNAKLFRCPKILLPIFKTKILAFHQIKFQLYEWIKFSPSVSDRLAKLHQSTLDIITGAESFHGNMEPMEYYEDDEFFVYNRYKLSKELRRFLIMLGLPRNVKNKYFFPITEIVDIIQDYVEENCRFIEGNRQIIDLTNNPLREVFKTTYFYYYQLPTFLKGNTKRRRKPLFHTAICKAG